MVQRVWAPAVLIALLACATAQAVPVTVNVRVEGSSSTIFEGPVTTDGKAIDKGDGPHPCDGTNGGAHPSPVPTMTAALDDAPIAGGWGGSWNATFQDFAVERVGPEAQDPVNFRYWGYALNYQFPQVGGCQQSVSAGDDLLFTFDSFGKPLLKLAGPNRAVAGQPATVTITDGTTGQAVEGATLAGAAGASGPDGRIAVTFAGDGVRRLKADKAGAVRSNTLEVCVEQPGTNACAGFVPTISTRPDVHDSVAPVARISGPRNGAKYRRGPRLLKGVVNDDPSGVRDVKIALSRKVSGRSCQWWSGRRERFVGTSCKKVFFFSIGSNRNWSYLMPRALPAGRYVLDVKAFDGRRNRDEKFVPGKNRTVFEVVPRKKRGAASAAARTGGARVQVMVVGTGGSLVRATTLRARATVVRASGRACKVAASTPLAALSAALRHARIGWHVRDFGTCERRRAGSSSQLFVDRVGTDRNRGRDGWVYKVSDFAPSVGAADVSAKRLRRRSTVLWFFCRQDLTASSCQRSLRVVPDATSGAAGAPLRVRVIAYDDRRSGKPASGAQVRLGPAGAVADANGVASIALPAPGRHTLTAEASDGSIPSFPVPIRVK
jgi:hypothetical protein